MEQITNIEIKNFKSIRHQKIEGCKRINVFVGPPNVGKSNILEALSLGSYIDTEYNAALKELMRFENIRDLFTFGQSEAPIELVFNDQLFRLEYSNDETATFLWLIKPENPDEDLDIIYKKRIVETRIESNITNLSTSKFNPEFFSFGELKKDIGKRVRKYVFTNNPFNKNYSVLELQSPFGDNLFEVLIYNNDLRKEFISLIESSGAKLLFDKQKNDLKVYYQLDESIIYSVAFKSIADTLQRLIFHKAAIKMSKNSTLLLEEPESHLYEPYILDISNSIKEDKNNNQFFIVTHNQYFIEELLRDEESRNNTNIYLVGLENNETKIKLMSPEKSKDVYQSGLNIFFNYQSLWDEN